MQSLTRSLCWAWHFLTIIPIPFIGQVEPSSRELARSMRWYPVVGYVLGSGLALLDRGFAAVVPPEARALLIVAALVVVTGGLHQDGLADTVDGLAKRGTPEERLGAMRDSRIGALGATALVLTLGLRYTGLLALVPSDWPFVLVCMPAIGRWSMVIGAYGVPYARSQGGLAAPFVHDLRWQDVLWATGLVSLGLVWAFGWMIAGILIAAGVLLTKVVTVYAVRLFGGITGDILGALNEMVEIVFILACPALLQTG